MTTPAPAKPRTTFSQEYIVARIEARIASLKSRVKDADEKINGFRQKKGMIDLKYIESASNEFGLLSQKLDHAMLSPGALDLEEIDKLVEAIGKTAYGFYHDKPILEYRDRQVLEPLLAENKDMQRELDLLEHAYAYVKESTIEEYTITSLSRLGLLDIVKFVLTPDAADRAKKRGRR